MPSTPEVLRVGGFVWRVEVLWQVKTHEHGKSDGNIGIAGEIGIDLERIGEECEEVLEAREEERIVEHAVDVLHSEVVGEYNLLCESVEYPEYGDAKLPFGEMKGLVKLRYELRCPYDRSGYKLRKERDIEAKVEYIVDGCYFLFIDIDGVRNHLEEVEGDAYWKYNPVNVESSVFAASVTDICKDVEYLQMGSEQVVEHIGEEIGILEVAQQGEVDNDA